jgi:hypothetical protein
MPADNDRLRLLVARVALGDHVAFRALYSALAPDTYDMVQAELAQSAHSGHVVRATFCEVWWLCAVELRDGGRADDIRAWIAGIAWRRCEERLRILALTPDSGEPGRTGGGARAVLEADHDQRTRIELGAMLAGPDVIVRLRRG